MHLIFQIKEILELLILFAIVIFSFNWIRLRLTNNHRVNALVDTWINDYGKNVKIRRLENKDFIVVNGVDYRIADEATFIWILNKFYKNNIEIEECTNRPIYKVGPYIKYFIFDIR